MGVTAAMSALFRRANSHYTWDTFNPHSYLAHNYLSLRVDDHLILEMMREFFSGAVQRPGAPAGPRHGLDIGTGANLYPSLAMLPFCQSVTMREFSAANVHWLRTETADFGFNWDKFWGVLTADPAYAALGDMRAVRDLLKERARVEQGSIFDLTDAAAPPPQPREDGLRTAGWGMGTMFFVAESLTRKKSEFGEAVSRFVQALAPDAPFACAFMRQSRGYSVDTQLFPAVAIDAHDVEECLASVAYDRKVRVIQLSESGDPLRDGYGGMILATGFRQGPVPGR